MSLGTCMLIRTVHWLVPMYVWSRRLGFRSWDDLVGSLCDWARMICTDQLGPGHVGSQRTEEACPFAPLPLQ